MLPAGAAPQIRPARPADRPRAPSRSPPTCATIATASGSGFLKLVAGMLGVGLDDLVQRETLAAPAAAGDPRRGLARRHGGDQRARHRRDPGARRRPRPAPRGRRPGRLHARRPAGQARADRPPRRARRRRRAGRSLIIESRTRASLSDEALAQRSQALTLMGEIANSRGDLDGALKRYNEALAGTAGIAAPRARRSAARCSTMRRTSSGSARSPGSAGRLAQAERAIREYQRLAERMIALEPDQARNIGSSANMPTTSLGAILIDLRRYRRGRRRCSASRSRDARSWRRPRRDNADYQKAHARSPRLAVRSAARRKAGSTMRWPSASGRSSLLEPLIARDPRRRRISASRH